MVYFPFLQPLFMENLLAQAIFPKFLSFPLLIYSLMKITVLSSLLSWSPIIAAS